MATKPKADIVPLRPAMDQAPAFMADDAVQYAGAGTSDRKEDNVIPFLYIAQSGTPQVNAKQPNYIPGLAPGMLFNTATKVFWNTDERPLFGVQAHFRKAEVEWIPRENGGGGFVMEHPINTPLVHEIKEVPKPNSKRAVWRVLPNGNHLVTTAYHYFILVETGEPVVISLFSSGLKVSREWNSLLRSPAKYIRGADGRSRLAPSFATLVQLRTVYLTKDNNSWYSLAFDDRGWVTQDIIDSYHMAKALYDSADIIKTAEPIHYDDQTEKFPNGNETNIVDDDPMTDDNPL